MRKNEMRTEYDIRLCPDRKFGLNGEEDSFPSCLKRKNFDNSACVWVYEECDFEGKDYRNCFRRD